MVFEISGKVGLVTGGARGLGFRFSRQLLQAGAKGVTIVDINAEEGQAAKTKLEEEFGPNVALFVKADITDYKQFENTFEKTVEHFGHVDILVNNAGIYIDNLWAKQIEINFKGTLHGILLAFHDYLIKHRKGSEAVIVNLSSFVAVAQTAHHPIYSSIKLGILGLTRNWGSADIYERTNIKVVAVCPGASDFPEQDKPILSLFMDGLCQEIFKKNFSLSNPRPFPSQSAEYLVDESLKVMKYAPNGSTWIIENKEPAYEYIFPDRSTMKGNLLKEI